jgi:nitrogen fixation NifU-like protein
MDVSEVPDLNAGWVIEQLGIDISPTRRKCALLGLKVMRGATTGDPSWPEE